MSGKSEAIEWVKSLKKGDKVILMEYSYNGRRANNILHINKVTPSGIVRTDEGLSFIQSKWTDAFYVCGRGNAGNIVPYDNDLAIEALCQMEKRKNEAIEKCMQNHFMKLCIEFIQYNSQIKFTLDEIKTLTSIFEKAKERNKI